MYTFETFQTYETKKLGILMIPNPFINNHINAHGATRVDQTLSEVPKYAVVDLADGSDGETRHRQRHACNKHKCRRSIDRRRQWSRHVSAHDRIIYDIYDEIITVLVVEVEGHYDDK